MAKSKAAAGRTRWKRFGVALIPATVVISGLTVAAANGAVPMSFAISGTAFKVSADKMVAEDVVQFGSVTKNSGPNGGYNNDSKPVILSGFRTASFDNLCQSVRVPLPFSIMGKDSVVMQIKSGSATAENMIADLAQMTGNAQFDGVQIGIDGSTTTKGPIAGGGKPGSFAQQVDRVTVLNAHQTVYSVSAQTFRLPQLDISVNFDNKECF